MKLLSLSVMFVLVGCTLASHTPPLSPNTTATPGVLPVTPRPTTPPPVTVTPSETPLPTVTPPPTATENPYPWTNELFTMYGVCFEAALDASGQVFVLRSAADHIRFYNEADNSGLCRRPVQRNPFEFEGGARVLAGLWSDGTGCTARHEVTDYTLTDDTLTIDVRFITEGDCNYELVRPFWVGIGGVDDVQINVERTDQTEETE